MMSTVEHENATANHIPYVPSSTTKLEEEGERGGRNLNPPFVSLIESLFTFVYFSVVP